MKPCHGRGFNASGVGPVRPGSHQSALALLELFVGDLPFGTKTGEIGNLPGCAFGIRVYGFVVSRDGASFGLRQARSRDQVDDHTDDGQHEDEHHPTNPYSAGQIGATKHVDEDGDERSNPQRKQQHDEDYLPEVHVCSFCW